MALVKAIHCLSKTLRSDVECDFIFSHLYLVNDLAIVVRANVMGVVDIERFHPNDVSRTLDWKLGKRAAPPWPEYRKITLRIEIRGESVAEPQYSCTGIKMVEGVDACSCSLVLLRAVMCVYVSWRSRFDCDRQKHKNTPEQLGATS